jgi:hypothetical protein
LGREGAAAGKPVRGHTATRSAPLRSRAQDADEWRKLSGGSVGKISYNEEESIAYGKNGQVREDFIKRSLRLNAATLDAFTSEVRARGGGGGGPPRHPPPPLRPPPASPSSPRSTHPSFKHPPYWHTHTQRRPPPHVGFDGVAADAPGGRRAEAF